MKDDLEGILGISDVSPKHLQYEIVGPRIFKAKQKLSSETRETDAYIAIWMGYARYPFKFFEPYLRLLVGLFEDDIQVFLKQYNSNIIIHERSPVIYSSEDISAFVYSMSDHEFTLQIK